MSVGYEVATTKDIKKALEARLNWKGFSVTKGRGTGSRYTSVRWTNGPAGGNSVGKDPLAWREEVRALQKGKRGRDV